MLSLPLLTLEAALLVDLDRYKEAEEPLSQMKEIMDNPDLTKLQPQEQSQGQGSGYDNNSMPIEKRLDGLHKFLVHRGWFEKQHVQKINTK